MIVTVTGGECSPEEIVAYKKYVIEKYPNYTINELIIHIEGDEVKLETHKTAKPFIRTRRVTGYLANTTRFNDGKLAELADREKHDISN